MSPSYLQVDENNINSVGIHTDGKATGADLEHVKSLCNQASCDLPSGPSASKPDVKVEPREPENPVDIFLRNKGDIMEGLEHDLIDLRHAIPMLNTIPFSGEVETELKRLVNVLDKCMKIVQKLVYGEEADRSTIPELIGKIDQSKKQYANVIKFLNNNGVFVCSQKNSVSSCLPRGAFLPWAVSASS